MAVVVLHRGHTNDWQAVAAGDGGWGYGRINASSYSGA